MYEPYGIITPGGGRSRYPHLRYGTGTVLVLRLAFMIRERFERGGNMTRCALRRRSHDVRLCPGSPPS